MNQRELLDFSTWTVSDMNCATFCSPDEMVELEDNLMNYFDELSQMDVVRMVLTYKREIECFQRFLLLAGTEK